ncbi:MAG: phosphate acyltransferase PlsX [Verrucomicrobiia bacterium]
MKIAVDAMGGDHGPQPVVEAAAAALALYPQIEHIFLVGIEKELSAKLAALPHDRSRLSTVHASEVVTMEDKAVEAIRRKRDSSLSRAVDMVRDGEADAVLSPGNTGAFMAAALIKLRTLPGVDRPGLATVMPSRHGKFLILDLGANADARPRHLCDYGVMGEIYARQILGVPNPRIGLFSIGTEEMKGNELTLEAHKLLKDSPVNFVGNIEGHDLFADKADVIVADGFTGNAVLKSCEATSHLVHDWMKEELSRNPLRKFGAWLATGAFRDLKKKANPDEYGGAILLGANGICIKAHGKASANAICSALRIAADAITRQVNTLIIEEIRLTHEKEHPAQPAPATSA